MLIVTTKETKKELISHVEDSRHILIDIQIVIQKNPY
jgi:dTDP-glucose pyrophosphorylase